MQGNSTNSNGSLHSDYAVLFYLRFIFYILFTLKLIEIVCRKNRKLSAKQKIETKYIGTHREMIKHYTEDQLQVMHQTVFNTLKNATQPIRTKNVIKKSQIKQNKTVCFSTQRNRYYDHPKTSQSMGPLAQTTSVELIDERQQRNLQSLIEESEERE